MSRLSSEAIQRAVRRWGENTGALTGSGRPDVGGLDAHNAKISDRVRAICAAIVEAIEPHPTSAVWCDPSTTTELGVQALNDTLEREGLPDS